MLFKPVLLKYYRVEFYLRFETIRDGKVIF